MSNHSISVWKKSRALGFSLLGNKKEFRKRSTLPGQHSEKRKRRLSTYALQNREKNRMRFFFGFLKENQLRNAFINSKKKTESSENKLNIEDSLLINLTSCLVNIIRLSGLANTQLLARQLIGHGHFLIDGKKVDKFTFQVKVGSVITPRRKELRENKIIKANLEQNAKFPDFLSFDKENLAITYLRLPFPEEVNKLFDTSLVVSWYSRRTK